MKNSNFSVLFVCLGNICRSPCAEGIFRAKAQKANLAQSLHIDSAGTSAFHSGEPCDSRSNQTASQFGYDLSSIRSRQVVEQDFHDFDLIIAMDKANLSALEQLKPANSQSQIKLFLTEYAPQTDVQEVPDPYYGGANGFVEVVELIEQASDGLIEVLRHGFSQSN